MGELIGLAKNRMNQFYNPALYKPAPEIELSREQRIAVNMGSEAAPTVAPSGMAGTGITYFAQVSAHNNNDVAPAPPPETWSAYQKKGQGHNGVTAMMDLLAADLDKDTQTAQVDEKNAQSEHETTGKEAYNTATTLKDLHLECDWLLSNFEAH